MQPRFANFFDGKWQISHQHHVVTAFHVWASFAEFVHVQLNACAVTEAVVFVITFDGFNFDSALDACHALQRLFDYIGLQLALTG